MATTTVDTKTTDDLVDRAMKDDSFLARIRAEPENVASEYNLSDKETQAIVSGDNMDAHEAFDTPTHEAVVVVLVSNQAQ